ncbi:MAG: ABC transporter ATP-binding protein [Candidatus Saccharibacteria bacterium]|nr:ABC transporter ATP-binding protein [Candidatus Saccharibacteria bacterium]
MFRYYYDIIKKFFSLKATTPLLLFHLLFSAFLTTASFLSIPYIASLIIDRVTEGNWEYAIYDTTAFFVATVVYVGAHHYNYWAYYKNALSIHNILQRRILKKVTELDEGFSENISSATIVSTSFADVNFVMRIPDYLFDFLTKIISIFISSIILIFVNTLLGILILILALLSLYVFTFHMRQRDKADKLVYANQDNISGLFAQIIDGHKEIHSFNMKQDLKDYLDHDLELWTNAYRKRRLHTNLGEVIVPAILGAGRLAIYLICVAQIFAGGFTIGTLVLIIGYFEDIQDNYYDIIELLYELTRCSVRVDRVHKILSYKTKHMLEFGKNKTDDITGRVRFDKVYFSYDGKNSVKDISFCLEPHSFTAIVGKSGSGKSTIFRLLLRLYKPTRGKIFLDEVNAQNYTKEIYASNVSIVTQKPFIFDLTIRENLSLVDSNVDRQIEACKIAGIHDDIMKLPKKYNTKLVDDAANLSAGQKQLLALARTLLSRSEVLLFDEVTSSLDDETSQKIAKILKELKKNHTIIMISHKPDLMKLADEIIVIDHGRIVGRGTHKDLLRVNKYYKTIQNMV